MDKAEMEARRVPKYLDKTNQIFGRDIDDLGILIGGPILLAMAAMNFMSGLPGAAKLPVVVGAIGTGMLLLLKQPSHLSATEWIETTIHGIFQPSKINHLSSTAGMEREAADYLEKGNWWETSGTTQELTGIRRIHETLDDDIGVIERNDRTFVGGIGISGVNMALATPEVWEQKVSQLARALNSLEYPVQIYITTAAYDIEEHSDTYGSRTDDRDIKARPILGAVLDAYLEQVVPSIEQGGLNKREYYILVKVDKSDVYTGEGGSSGTLANLPVIGGAFEESSDEPAKENMEDLMVEELTQRVTAISSNIGSIQGVDTHHLRSGEMARLNHEYWSGTDLPPEVEDRFERILGIVVGENDLNEKRVEAGLDQPDATTAETKIESEEDPEGPTMGGQEIEIDANKSEDER